MVVTPTDGSIILSNRRNNNQSKNLTIQNMMIKLKNKNRKITNYFYTVNIVVERQQKSAYQADKLLLKNHPRLEPVIKVYHLI